MKKIGESNGGKGKLAVSIFEERFIDENGAVADRFDAFYVHTYSAAEEKSTLPYLGRLGVHCPRAGLKHEYSIENVLFGKNARRFLFDIDYAALPDFEKWLLGAVMFELNEDPSIVERFRVKRLLGAAAARLKNNGFYVPCSRCGGSGNYSYCQMYGTKCFKCAGGKLTLPNRITNSWKASVEAFDFKSALAGGAAE